MCGIGALRILIEIGIITWRQCPSEIPNRVAFIKLYELFRFNCASSIHVHEKISYFIKLFTYADAYGDAEEMVNKEGLVQRRLQ